MLPAARAGRHLPRREHERGVPRRDDHGRPGRHAHDRVARALRRPLALLVGGREVGVGAEVDGPAGNEAGAHRLVQHAHVDRLDDGDLVVVGVDQVGQPVQVLGATLRAEVGPVAEGHHRRRHRGVGRVGVAAGDVGELPRPVERRAVLERRRRRHALAADEVVRADLDALDVGDVGRRSVIAGSARGALAAELPVAAERRRQDLLGLAGLGTDVVADRRRAADDAVGQRPEPLHLDRHDVARLDRPRVGRRAGEQHVARHERDRPGDVGDEVVHVPLHLVGVAVLAHLAVDERADLLAVEVPVGHQRRARSGTACRIP